ncbi:MAG: prealbumin-like fold domain-containing protein [Eubacteriales bacterium]|nr:prealbumin-like fold domain-containing protein [Eubacteriales bacterium]
MDESTKKELPGAKLCVFDKDGKTVEKWTSGKEPHLIERLIPGTYTLHEEVAPDGYEAAKDVKFTVRETGEIQKVIMVDVRKGNKKPSDDSSKGGKTRKSHRSSPGTGDTTDIFFWIILLVLAGILSGAVWYMKKKMKKDTDQRK